MNDIKKWAWLALLMVCIAGCDSSQAPDTTSKERLLFSTGSNEQIVDDYIVHVNGLTTDQLSADTARAYHIIRAKDIVMLNVSIRRNLPNQIDPIESTVSVIVKNLNEQVKDMMIREIKNESPPATYYVGTVSVNNQETLVFDINIQPKHSTETYLLRYRQQFFTH